MERGDVVMNGNIGPVLAEDLLAERFTLHKLDRSIAANDAVSGVGEASDAGKQIKQAKVRQCSLRAPWVEE